LSIYLRHWAPTITREQLGHEIDLSTVDFEYIAQHEQGVIRVTLLCGGSFVCRHADGVSLREEALRVDTIDEVHGDPQLAVGLASVVYADDVRVEKRCSEIGLAEEPLPKFGIRGHVRRQNLERVATRQSWMLSEINLAHSSGPEKSQYGVSRENGTVR
jgi:hypothetical protein